MKQIPRLHLLACALLFLLVSSTNGQSTSAVAPLSKAVGTSDLPAIIPRPVSMVVGEGRFVLNANIEIVADEASLATALQLSEYIKPATGFNLNIVSRLSADSPAAIRLTQDPSLTKLGKEGYCLSVTSRSIQLSAATQVGLFYGVQTLRQMLPVAIYSPTPVTNVEWVIPCVTIEDQPRFAWRGLMLDSGHDFQTKAFVLRFIDLMALHKLNQFHWHLTDMGTWSIEIKGYPLLLEPGSRRLGVRQGHYTQDDIREVVRYAAERHITILPEIDMPGHMSAAIMAYPDLECSVPRGLSRSGKPAGPWEVCVGDDKTYAFAEAVLSQVAELFPSPYIHIGGDECPKKRWLQCPQCKEKMAKENLADGNALQSYFIKRLERFLQSKGKKMIGWDEILEGGLAPNATVMSWRSMDGGIEAARSGHDVVMGPRQFTYLDYPNVSVYTVNSFEPVPTGLTVEQSGHILGGQGQMWTDNLPSEKAIDAMVHPRSAALAEVLWSRKVEGSYADLMSRLNVHVERLGLLGVAYRPLMTGTPVASWSTDKVFTQSEVIEWPLPNGLSGNGLLRLKFVTEQGEALPVDKVEIIQAGKVLAAAASGDAKGNQKVYSINLPAISSAPLVLKVAVVPPANSKKGGVGTVYIE